MKTITLSRILLCLSLLFLLNPNFAKSNLSISQSSEHPIPLTVNPEGSTSAYFTITNNTSKTLRNYSLQLANSTAHATQNLSGGYCPKSMTLQPGASCTLTFDITGEAYSTFALCSGSSCTTSSIEAVIKVKSAPSTPYIAAVGSFLCDPAGNYPFCTYLNPNTGTSLDPTFYPNFNVRPMIAQVTNDSGWTWANNLVLPAAKGKDIVQAGYLNSVTCRTNIDPNLQTHCVAVGAYNYMTEFTYTQTSCNEIASNCIKDYLTSSDCFCAEEFLFPPPPQENCTAGLGGYYCDFLTFTNYHGATLPLIETYSDQPDPIWAPAITDSITKPYPSNNYVLNSVSCNLAGGCLSVGSYSSDVTFSVDTTTPYLTYNTFISSPSLWQFFRAFQPNVPLENNSYGAFTSVYCMEPSSGNEHLLCLASGNYHIFPGNTDSYPMLAKFDTLPIPATPTIEYPITAGMPTNSTGILTNVACSENCTTANFDTADCFCATGGNYMNIFPQELLAVKDAASANTWKYITPDLMPTNLGNQINSVSCGVDNPPSNTPYCVAVGSYAYTTPPSKGSFAMNGAIVQSGSDTHWLTRPVTCNIGGTPWSCVLSGVSCVNSFCMAAGYASPPNNDPTQQVKIDPIYVISTDAGVTWGAQSNNNIELIPTNLYATKLNTVNCQRYSLTSDICTVGGTGSYKRNILAPFLSTIIIGTDGSEGTWTTFVDGTPATNKPLAYQASPTQNAPFNGIGSLYESSSIPQSPITTPLQPYCNGQRGC